MAIKENLVATKEQEKVAAKGKKIEDSFWNVAWYIEEKSKIWSNLLRTLEKVY